MKIENMRRVYTSLTESYMAIGWLRRRKQYISGPYAGIVYIYIYIHVYT